MRRLPPAASTRAGDQPRRATTTVRALPAARLEAFSDGVFAIAITLLVLELHVPTGREPLVATLEHDWPSELGYLASFAFIGGVWIAHSTMTRFIRMVDPALMRLNLLLLLFVSLLPFTTAIVATHLFASLVSGNHGPSLTFGAERVAAVMFGLDLTLAALMTYLVIRHAARTPGIAVDDVADEELRDFAVDRRVAFLSQGAATVVSFLVPLVAVLMYLGVSVFFIVAPFTLTRAHERSREG